MPMTPGEKRGPYEIIEPIGKGGMGEADYISGDPVGHAEELGACQSIAT
jgi:hypothetical protein